MVFKQIKTKRGDQSLNMIFGIFILLIVAVVVITLFLNTTNKATKGMAGVANQYFSQQNKEKAITSCEQLCDAAQAPGAIDNEIQFCKTGYSVDWNQNGINNEKVQYGRWQFCEGRVPCFLITTISDTSKCRITPEDCHRILTDTSSYDILSTTYEGFMNNSPQGVCNLDAPEDPSLWSPKASNWRLRFLEDDIKNLEQGERKLNKSAHKMVTCYNAELLKVVQAYTNGLYPTQSQIDKIKAINESTGLPERPPCSALS